MAGKVGRKQLNDFLFYVIIFAGYFIVESVVDHRILEQGEWEYSERNFNYSIITKLMDPNGHPKDNFGRSVSITTNYALIGSPEFDADDDSDDSGRVFFFVTKYGKWELVRNLENGVAGDYFGWSVSIHRSLTGAVGAWRDDTYGDFSGAVYVYDLVVDKNARQSNATRIFASNAAASGYFGYSVALGDDENGKAQLIVGAYGMSNKGQAYLYRRDSAGNWYELEILQAGDSTYGDRFGWSVDVYVNHAVVGAPLHMYNGAVYVFWFVDGSWELNQKIVQGFASSNDDEMVYDFFGISVATGDGIVAIGAPGNSIMGGEAGAVYVYADSKYTHTQHPTGSRALSTSSVAEVDTQTTSESNVFQIILRFLSYIVSFFYPAGEDEANPAIASAAERRLDNLDEYSFLQVLAAPDAKAYNRFGWSIGYDGSRRRIIVGTDLTKLKTAGEAYIFGFDSSDYFKHEVTLAPKDESGNILFGISCSISGDHALVGAARGTGKITYSGTAYSYKAQT